jgi:hypothetical protein
MRMKTILAGLVLALGMGATAQAATCSIGGYNFTLGVSGGAACVAGNDQGADGIQAQSLTFFGLNGWLLGDSDAGGGTGDVEFGSLGPIVDVASGSWSIASYNGFDQLMIVLKASTFYGAFLISEATSGLSGTWSITRDDTEQQCTGRGQNRVCIDVPVLKPTNLSHTSLYHQPAPAPVPVPAAGLLLLGALGGLGLMRRRRRAA